jgi:flavin reductase (DIM6/NTAB) family NADH-FMN oxidoreductase RutF
MTKIQITPQPLLCTTPTVLVGSMVNGKSNFMAVAWCGVANSLPPMVSVAIRASRHTLKGIQQYKEFSVNIPSTEQVKEADYCGIISGAKVDKTKICGFNILFGNLKNAPLIEQCPVNLACRVEHIISLGTHELVIGRVEETLVTETCLTEGKPDMRKIKPIIYSAGSTMEYIAFGESLGKAFIIGRDLEKK